MNAAAMSPTPRVVRAAVDRFYREVEEGGDLFWDDWLLRREEARAVIARFVGATPEEIAFVANTSVGMNLVVDILEGRGAVLSDALEFPVLTLPWLHRGVEVHFIEAEDGILHPERFEEGRAPEAGVISISQVQFSNGCRQELSAFGSRKGARRLVVSGSQGVGAFGVDVRASGVDALCCAGHKWLCAAYGAGFVYLSRELLALGPPRELGWMSVEEPFAFDNRRYQVLSSAKRSELGCPPFGGIFALEAAARFLSDIGLERIERYVLALNTYLTDSLAREGFSILSPLGAHRSGQTLVALPSPARAVEFLKARNIVVTEKPQGIRVSTHLYNNEEDVDALLAALREYR